MFNQWLAWVGLSLAGAAMTYSVIALVAVLLRLQSPAPAASRLPAVTVFKPVCGAEPETYECLRSFCDQDYPEFQIVFGVAELSDPVVAVVERLQREFPARDLRLVVDRRQHGSSRKVSNLVNMMPLARHDYFVIADSDVRVGRDYLVRVVAPLLDDRVGIVTCSYRGVPRPGLWSLLGSQFINEWFIPSVRVAALFGSRAFAFGRYHRHQSARTESRGRIHGDRQSTRRRLSAGRVGAGPGPRHCPLRCGGRDLCGGEPLRGSPEA